MSIEADIAQIIDTLERASDLAAIEWYKEASTAVERALKLLSDVQYTLVRAYHVSGEGPQ